MSLLHGDLKPLQSMAASMFFRKKRILVILPRQEGKTELGVRILHDLTARPVTSSSMFVAKDHKSAKKATYEKFTRLFDKSLFEVNTETVYLKKHPTSIIYIASADKDPSRQRGGTYSMIHWSEVAFSKIEHGETITGVFDKIFQPTLRKTGGYAYLESTCNGKNGWWDIWNNYKEYGFERLRVSLSDMVYLGLLPEEEYDEIKRTTHPDVFLQEYECEFISFRGRAYPEFTEDLFDHDMPGPEPWQTVAIAIDWGYHPSATCVLFAYIRDGIIHVFDEIFTFKQLPEDTAKAINERLAYWRIGKFAAVADHEQDRIDELIRAQIPCGKADKANVMGVRMEIKTILWKKRLRVNPIRCPNFVRDMQLAAWDDEEDGEIDYDECTSGHFDAEAAARYLVRQLGGLEAVKPVKNPHSGIDTASGAEWLERQRRMGNNL